MSTPYSYVRLTADGATTAFGFSFPYLDTAHIQVRVNAVETAFTWLNPSALSITPAPTSGAIVEIRRVTPKDSPLVDFTDGSTLLEGDLDMGGLFSLYCAQEAMDAGDSSIQLDAFGDFDAKSHRIKNVTDPTNPQDAATRKYVLDTDASARSYSDAGDASLDSRITSVNSALNGSIAAARMYAEALASGVGPGGLGAFSAAGTGAVTRTFQDKIRETGVSVLDFGADPTGVLDSTISIQQAIDAVSAAGGGEVFFPKGNYKVRKDNPSGSNSANPDDYALHLQTSKVTLRGIKGASRIFADSAAPARFITLRVGVLPIVNGGVELSDIRIQGIEFDGSYLIPTEGSVADDGNTILWIHGVKRATLSDLYVHNSSDYGIGIQNGGHQDFLLENIVIEDTMADGIDVKNNGDADRGNRMNHITVRRFGRGTNMAQPFAGIDVMGPGWELSNIIVEEFGDLGTPNAGVRFKQGEYSESHGDGGHYGTLANFYIKAAGTGYSLQAGVKVSAHSVKLAQGTVRNCVAEGVLVEQQECSVSAVTTAGCATGFRTRNSAYTTNGDRTLFAACVSRSNVLGFDIETMENTLVGCVARANDTNVEFGGAGGQNRWIGGEIANHAVKAVTNSGSNNVIRDAIGFLTDTQVESPTFDVTTTGEKTILIPHGLQFPPPRARCQAVLLRSGNNVPWSVSRFLIVSTDATNVTCRVLVSSASATVGDTATIALSVSSSAIPAM